ncbi:flap structure-specific endonuclease 1 [Paraphysoderma sedebokerense]|nr:flap structure-specific endonuclease 1 [Paraphysoderma sedebokerense]
MNIVYPFQMLWSLPRSTHFSCSNLVRYRLPIHTTKRYFHKSFLVMGIHGLTKVIGDWAPAAIKENDIKNYFGRKVAIDASMSIYQFLIAVRSDGQMLANESGETTSHLMGIFYRTIRMVENGIKPCYVFDGKPPEMKSSELAKRSERREEAEKNRADAEEKGDAENMDKFSKRTVKVTREHNTECQKLLKLMGIPYVEAPGEAEAQAAVLAKAGKVYAAGSEDMDTLTFHAPILLRHLTFSEARKMPISEIHLDKVLEGMEITMDQFIDLCILLGCDYCDSIKGIGPKTAVNLIKEYGTIEKIIENTNKKHNFPEDWPYQRARQLFKTPDASNPEELDLKWEDPDEEGIVQFLVREKNFNEDRVRNGVKKLQKNRNVAQQGRLDTFFKVLPKDSSAGSKRKASDKASKGPVAKKGKPTAKGVGKGKK